MYRKKTSKYVLIIFITFILIYLLNYLTGYTGDDYMYHYFFESGRPSYSTIPLTLGDLPASLWNHYCTWNGRILTHALVQFFMIYNKIIFNICNSIVFILTGFLLLAHIRPNFKNWTPYMLVIIYASMFFFFPHFGLSVLWLSGSCNYLWMCALLLFYLLFYRNYAGDTNTTTLKRIAKTLFMFILGLFSGCSNENSGGAVILLAFLFLCYWKWKKWKIPVWSICGIGGSCLGLLIILLAPGSKSRIENGLLSTSVLFKRMREFLGFSFRYLAILCIILLIVSIKYYIDNSKNIYLIIETLFIPFVYCLSGFACILVLLASPVISGKSWIWTVSFVMISIGIIWDKINDQIWKNSNIIKLLFIIFICLTSIRYVSAFCDIRQTYQEQIEQVNEINSAKQNGNSAVTVNMLTPSDNLYNSISRTPNLSEQADAWFNQWMALYYSIDEIYGNPQSN